MNTDESSKEGALDFPEKTGSGSFSRGTFALFRRLARTMFWTLCVCAYSSGIYCILVLFRDDFLPISEPEFHDWPIEARLSNDFYLRASVCLIPFALYFRNIPLYRWAGLGVWLFFVVAFFAFPVF